MCAVRIPAAAHGAHGAARECEARRDVTSLHIADYLILLKTDTRGTQEGEELKSDNTDESGFMTECWRQPPDSEEMYAAMQDVASCGIADCLLLTDMDEQPNSGAQHLESASTAVNFVQAQCCWMAEASTHGPGPTSLNGSTISLRVRECCDGNHRGVLGEAGLPGQVLLLPCEDRRVVYLLAPLATVEEFDLYYQWLVGLEVGPLLPGHGANVRCLDFLTYMERSMWSEGLTSKSGVCLTSRHQARGERVLEGDSDEAWFMQKRVREENVIPDEPTYPRRHGIPLRVLEEVEADFRQLADQGNGRRARRDLAQQVRCRGSHIGWLGCCRWL